MAQNCNYVDTSQSKEISNHNTVCVCQVITDARACLKTKWMQHEVDAARSGQTCHPKCVQ